MTRECSIPGNRVERAIGLADELEEALGAGMFRCHPRLPALRQIAAYGRQLRTGEASFKHKTG
jgi:hypothetical protein